jgi:hypothetical protein
VSNRTARRVLVLASIAAFLAVLLGSTVVAWFHQRSEISALRDQVRSQQRERWADPAYVEQQARQRLKFVKPGERSYTVLDPDTEDGVDLTGTGVAGSPNALPWYQAVWESTRTADAPGAHR